MELNEIDNNTVSREIPNVWKCSNLFINNPYIKNLPKKKEKMFGTESQWELNIMKKYQPK